jgi:hypothetical protein
MSASFIGAASIAARLSALGLVQRHGDAEDEDLGVYDAPCTPAVVFLEYEGSARAVTLHAVWQAGAVTRLRGFCHLRGALREFRSDRIVSLIDLSTGEVPDDASGWLASHALNSASPLNAVLPELTVLAFLAKADGSLDPDETEAIVDFVLAAADRPIPDLDEIRRKVARLTPSFAQLPQAVGQIVKDAERLARFKRAMRRLVDADRDLPDDEQIAASHILQLIGQSVAYQADRAAGRARAEAAAAGAQRPPTAWDLHVQTVMAELEQAVRG